MLTGDARPLRGTRSVQQPNAVRPCSLLRAQPPTHGLSDTLQNPGGSVPSRARSYAHWYGKRTAMCQLLS